MGSTRRSNKSGGVENFTVFYGVSGASKLHTNILVHIHCEAIELNVFLFERENHIAQY